VTETRHIRLFEREPEEPTKQCRYCGQAKPVSAFARDPKAKGDASSHYCKVCAHQTKRCPKCGRTKSLLAFSPGVKPGGVQTYCKPCRSVYVYYRAKHPGLLRETARLAQGLDSWSQVPSVVRELAELEADLSGGRKKDDEEIQLRSHQAGLVRLLKKFLRKKLNGAPFSKTYRFGTVRFRSGALRLALRPTVAMRYRDRP